MPRWQDDPPPPAGGGAGSGLAGPGPDREGAGAALADWAAPSAPSVRSAGAVFVVTSL
jgi:hypothetical protein